MSFMNNKNHACEYTPPKPYHIDPEYARPDTWEDIYWVKKHEIWKPPLPADDLLRRKIEDLCNENMQLQHKVNALERELRHSEEYFQNIFKKDYNQKIEKLKKEIASLKKDHKKSLVTCGERILGLETENKRLIKKIEKHGFKIVDIGDRNLILPANP